MNISGTHSSAVEAKSKPAGAAEVRESILDAAVKLMRERGNTDVALREIAREANVNHGLVHRHFGTKHDVLIAVLQRHSEIGAGFLRDAHHIDDAIDRLWEHPNMAESSKLVAGALLNGIAAESIAEGHALRTLEHLLQTGNPHADADAVTSTAVAISCLILGWGIFGDYLSANARATDPQKLRTGIQAILHTLVQSRQEQPLHPKTSEIPANQE